MLIFKSRVANSNGIIASIQVAATNFQIVVNDFHFILYFCAKLHYAKWLSELNIFVLAYILCIWLSTIHKSFKLQHKILQHFPAHYILDDSPKQMREKKDSWSSNSHNPSCDCSFVNFQICINMPRDVVQAMCKYQNYKNSKMQKKNNFPTFHITHHCLFLTIGKPHSRMVSNKFRRRDSDNSNSGGCPFQENE